MSTSSNCNGLFSPSIDNKTPAVFMKSCCVFRVQLNGALEFLFRAFPIPIETVFDDSK